MVCSIVVHNIMKMDIRSHISNKNSIALVCVFLAALLLRLFNLSALPLGAHADEVMNGYVGRFILQNGVDLYGNSWPLLYFNNFGDFPNVVPMYISGAFTFLFGANIFAIRLPIALFGALSIFPLYGILGMLFKEKWIGVAGALLLALTPWHIVLSRATAEGVIAGFAMLCALWVLIKGVQTNRVLYGLIAAVLCSLTYFLYPSYRVLVPLMWLVVPFLWKDKWDRFTMIVLTFLFFGLTFGIAQTDWGRGRFQQTSIFASGHEVEERTQRFVYGSGGSPVWLTRVFHNKGVVGAREFIHQYMSYFSGDFLLSRGGLPERYKVPDVGLLHYVVALSFVLLLLPRRLLNWIGISYDDASPLKPLATHLFAFICWIVVIIPIPSALTRDDVPNVHRTALLGILYVIPTMYALGKLVTWRLRKIPVVVVLIVSLMLIESLYFVRMYTVHADAGQALWRHDELNEVIAYVQENASQYDKVFVPSGHQMALRYLLAQNNFDKDLAGKFKQNIYLDHVENIYFYDSDCPSKFALQDGELLPELDDKKILVFDRIECEAPSSKVLNTILELKSALHVDVYRVLER